MMGAAAALLAYLLDDDRASEWSSVWAMTACIALLGCSYLLLSPRKAAGRTS
jgi:hypothetical protein